MVMIVSLPLSVLADMAPMSREEWERLRQLERRISIAMSSADMPSTTSVGFVLAALLGVFLAVCVFAVSKEYFHRKDTWRNFLSKTCMKWVILTAFILAGCLYMEILFCPCSTFIAMVKGKTFEHNELSLPHDETYEEYLFYERHCRKCGTALSYHIGRYCPKCNPRATKEWKFGEKTAE